MSYDFQLYTNSARKLVDPPELERGNVSLDGPNRLEEDDVPSEYLPIVGKKRWLYQIHLEGEINEQGRLFVNDWLRSLIINSKGILIDQQTNSFEAVNKSGNISPSNHKKASLGSMSFFFEDGERFYASGFESMLTIIANTFSAAMPTRYGYYEPLQEKTKQGEYLEIVSTFQKDTSLLLKSPAPFGHIYMSVACDKTFERYHPKHFIRFKTLCVELDVVYAEILETKESSAGWLWYGLPNRKMAHTICIGPTYQSVWPEFSSGGSLIGDHHRVFSIDRFGNKPPQPSSDLLAPDRNHQDIQGIPKKAQIFPFDYEFSFNKYIW